MAGELQSDAAPVPAEPFGFPADDVHEGLCQAAANGEIVEMKRLLDSGASPNSCDKVLSVKKILLLLLSYFPTFFFRLHQGRPKRRVSRMAQPVAQSRGS